MLCSAETDLVLPLIRNDPTCLDVENGAGVTARQLLQDFKDRVKRTHRWRHCHSEVWDSLLLICTCDIQIFNTSVQISLVAVGCLYNKKFFMQLFLFTSRIKQIPLIKPKNNLLLYCLPVFFHLRTFHNS